MNECMVIRKFNFGGEMIIRTFFIFLSCFCILFSTSCVTSKAPRSQTDVVFNLIERGNKFAQVGKFYESLEQYKRALIIDNLSETAKRNSGIVLVKLGRYQESVKYFYEVRDSFSSDPEFFYFFGEALRGVKAYHQALDYYSKAKEIAPEDHRVLKSMAWVYLKMGNTKEAEKIINPYFKKNKNDLQAMLIMSHILNKRKKYSQSIKILKTFEDARFAIVGRDKALVETEKILLLESLGNTYEGLNNCKKALKIYSLVLQLRPFLVTSLNATARCNLATNQQGVALSKLERSLAVEPSNPETLYLLGNAYLGSDRKRAKFYYSRFLEEAQRESSSFTSEILKVTETVNQLNDSNQQNEPHFN